jgi:hypothetical protein
MSIELKFGLFWAGAKLSYLRYLTFASLRHFHPNAPIYLYVATEYDKNAHKWGREEQDFIGDQKYIGDQKRDYLEKLKDIDVTITEIKAVGNPLFCPILQADLFRWAWMKDNGGFYLDTDQIVLKSFETLPLDKEFIYCRYMEPQCGDYIPTGALGMEKDSPIADIAIDSVLKAYSPNNYNSSGPFMMRYAINRISLSRSINAPFYYFYPIHTSNDVWKLYEGKFGGHPEAYCVHWFGGHPLSQQFNKSYTEDFAKSSKDYLSVTLRNIGVI